MFNISLCVTHQFGKYFVSFTTDSGGSTSKFDNLILTNRRTLSFCSSTLNRPVTEKYLQRGFGYISSTIDHASNTSTRYFTDKFLTDTGGRSEVHSRNERDADNEGTERSTESEPYSGVFLVRIPVAGLLEMFRKILHDHDLPPLRHLQNGTSQRPNGRRRRETQGERSRRTASRRRVDYAAHHFRKHERAGHHDSGEGFGHDQAGPDSMNNDRLTF